MKQAHERFVTAILSCDVFPNLDKTDPLWYPEEDVIPDKFGSKWFENLHKTVESQDGEQMDPEVE